MQYTLYTFNKSYSQYGIHLYTLESLKWLNSKDHSGIFILHSLNTDWHRQCITYTGFTEFYSQDIIFRTAYLKPYTCTVQWNTNFLEPVKNRSLIKLSVKFLNHSGIVVQISLKWIRTLAGIPRPMGCSVGDLFCDGLHIANFATDPPDSQRGRVDAGVGARWVQSAFLRVSPPRSRLPGSFLLRALQSQTLQQLTTSSPL